MEVEGSEAPDPHLLTASARTMCPKSNRRLRRGMDALPADYSDAVGRRFSEGAALALRGKLWARREEVCE